MSETELRELFEKWASGFGTVFPLDKDPCGDYLSVLTGNIWVLCRQILKAAEKGQN
jgi:hypothetical protein